jgi:hypothetical protein
MPKENTLNNYKEALIAFNPTFAFYKAVVVEEILKEIQPISIYLVGSFGRMRVHSIYLTKASLHCAIMIY